MSPSDATSKSASAAVLDTAEGSVLSVPVGTAVGRPGFEHTRGILSEEFARDLRGKKADRVYREMIDTAPVLGAAVLLISSLVRQVTWRFDQRDEGTTDESLMPWWSTLLDDMDHTMGAFIAETSEALIVHGFAPVEIVGKLRRGDHPEPAFRSSHEDGLWGIRRLMGIAPSTREEWIFDREDQVLALVQQIPTDQTRRVIPADKMMVIRLRERKGSPEGVSLLRPAYHPYFHWKRLTEIESIGFERNVAGYPMITAPVETWTDGTPANALLPYLRDTLRQVRQNELFGVLMPAAEDAGGKTGYGFELISASGAAKAEMDPAIQRHRSEMALAVLSQFLLLGQQSVGSFALSSDQSNLLSQALGAILQAIAQSINRTVVPLLARLNGWDVLACPVLTHSDIEDVDLQRFSAAYMQLVQAGALTPQEADETHVRSLLELPAAQASQTTVDTPSEDLGALDLALASQ